MQQDMPTYKVVLIGGGNCGKTTFCKRHLDGDFEKKYIATLGVEVHPLVMNTSKGPIRFNLWDCAGQEKFGGLRDGYYIQADACILFYTNEKETTKYLIDLMRVSPKAHVVVVFSKVDLISDEEMKKKFTKVRSFIEKTKLRGFSISSKSNYNFEKPFLEIARAKHGEDLSFFEWNS